MGGQLSCPAGFEQGPNLSCHIQCPGEFKYVQSGGGSAPLVEECVIAENNDYRIKLTSLPALVPNRAVPSYYKEERDRFDILLREVRARYIDERPIADAIKSAAFENQQKDAEYSQIVSEYASYNSAGGAVAEIEDAMKKLKPLRPKTAPAEDLSLERRKLLGDRAPSMLLLQISLFIIFLCLLTYAFVPMPYANYAVFLLLSTGVTVGIFLTKL